MNQNADVPGPLAGISVLVVDDEFLIALDVEIVLLQAGAAGVTACTSLDEGVTLAESQRFDAAVLDVRLDEDSSAPIARRLADRGVGIVFYSGQPVPGELRRDHPGAVVLVKPSRSPDLVEAVRRQSPRAAAVG